MLEQSPLLERLQVIVVDDSSRDRTAEVLAGSPWPAASPWPRPCPTPSAPTATSTCWRAAPAATARSTGSSCSTPATAARGRRSAAALRRADGAITVIHDADLEYHPRDLLRFLPVFVEEQADAVFGSRFAGGAARRALLFRHELGNRLLTFLTNLVTNVNLTDMETCYKAVRTDLLRSIPLVSDDFRLEPELTIKLAKREARIFEVPISYSGRTYQEGKKIGWRDGFKALGRHPALLVVGPRLPGGRLGLADPRPAGPRPPLQRLDGRHHPPLLRPARPRDRLGHRQPDPAAHPPRPVRRLRHQPALPPLAAGAHRRPPLPRRHAHRRDPRRDLPARRRAASTPWSASTWSSTSTTTWRRCATSAPCSAPAGRAIVLVPQGPEVFGTLDEVLGHRRRYTVESLARLAADAGFTVREMVHFNRVGRPAWWLNGRLLKRRDFGLFQIMMLNLLTPLFRLVDRALPFDALSLIAVLEPVAPEAATTPAPAARPAAGTTPGAGDPAPGAAPR